MLGLRPRLRARTLPWSLVNKHPHDLHLSSQPSWQQQPVEEGADSGLPPLPTSPTTPATTLPNLKLPAEALVEEQTSANMAPVSCSSVACLSFPPSR